MECTITLNIDSIATNCRRRIWFNWCDARKQNKFYINVIPNLIAKLVDRIRIYIFITSLRKLETKTDELVIKTE